MTRRSLHRRNKAGFTLVELMVAVVIGALIIMALFTIGGGSTRHFQEQQRIGVTQRSVRMAMDRLRRDLARTGYLGVPSNLSPNVRSCPTPAAPRNVHAIWFQDTDTPATATLAAANGLVNNVSADRLRLIGNYTTGDEYLIETINGAGNLVRLQPGWLAFRRAFVTQAGNMDTVRFSDVFRVGRMLHLATRDDKHIIVHITGSTLNASGTQAQISISPSVPPGTGCYPGFGEGMTASPLSEVEYFIGPPLAGSHLQPSNAAVTGPATLLIRHELNMADGTELANTRRAVLEYAVDFNLDFIIDTQITAGLPPNITQQLGPAAQATVQNQPWQVRGAVARITARTPEQDPRFPWPTDPAARANRYQVFPAQPGAARVRRATAEVAMPNMIPR